MWMTLLQIFGWVGSALLVFSVLQSKFMRFRIINGIASAALAIYNACLGVWPAVAMNGVLVIIDAYYIWKLSAGRRDNKVFTYIRSTATDSAVAWFFKRHGQDIASFHPEAAARMAGGGAEAAVIFHDDAAIGLVVFQQVNGAGTGQANQSSADAGTGTGTGTGTRVGSGSGTQVSAQSSSQSPEPGRAELLVDYVIPSYRDFTPGSFVFSDIGPLAENGITTVFMDKPKSKVANYLRQVGFQETPGNPPHFELTLPATQPTASRPRR